MNMSQDELASRAGIGVVTVSRLEGGKGSSLGSFIKVAQVLRQEDWLECLAPQTSVSPIQIHALGKPRQRARARTAQRRPSPGHYPAASLATDPSATATQIPEE
ncbi:MAG: helix-turn-helix transcriptional regulator [Coriobacteriia bacterium]|nr:helix-turn-helix transcriptional regulator [Coriobacteriia bacterium]